MKHRGFTLIEVLVSLAIFALAAVGLGAAYSSVLQARMALKQDEQYLDDLARTRAAMLETINFDSLDIGGDVNLPGDRKAHWKAKAEPTTVSDLFNVTLTMAIQRETNGEFTPDITETSMLLRPTWSIVSDRQKIIDAARERLFQQRGYNETDPGPGGLVSAPTPYKNPLAGKGKGGNGKGGNGQGNGNRGGNGQGGNGQGNGQGRGGNGGNGTPGQNGNGQGGGNRGGGAAPAPGQGGAPARAF
jgi:general secretion pathway protein I